MGATLEKSSHAILTARRARRGRKEQRHPRVARSRAFDLRGKRGAEAFPLVAANVGPSRARGIRLGITSRANAALLLVDCRRSWSRREKKRNVPPTPLKPPWFQGGLPHGDPPASSECEDDAPRRDELAVEGGCASAELDQRDASKCVEPLRLDVDENAGERDDFYEVRTHHEAPQDCEILRGIISSRGHEARKPTAFARGLGRSATHHLRIGLCRDRDNRPLTRRCR